MQLDLGLDFSYKKDEPVKDLTRIVEPGCTRCERAFNREHIVFGEGNLSPRIMFVGLHPDEDASTLGVAFSDGRESVILKRILSMCSINESDAYFTYVVKCGSLPPGAKIIKKCGEYLFSEINNARPKLVVLIGPKVAKHVLPEHNLKLNLHHGTIFTSAYYPGIKFLPIKDLKAIFADPSTETEIVNAIVFGLNQVGRDTIVPAKRDYYTLDSLEKIEKFSKYVKKYDTMSFDIETNGEKLFWNTKVCCFAVSWAPGKAAFFPWTKCVYNNNAFQVVPAWSEADGKKALEMMHDILRDKQLVLHRGKYDLKVVGSHFNWTDLNYHWDTAIGEATSDNTAITVLKHLAWKYSDIGGYERQLDLFKFENNITGNYSHIPDHVIRPYCSGDADVTFRAYLVQQKTVDKIGADFIMRDINMRAARAFLGVEQRGVIVDTAYLNKQKLAYETDIAAIEHKIHTIAGVSFNIASADQLGEILFHRLKLPVINLTENKDESTDKDTLKKLLGKHQIIEPLMEYRKKTKTLKTYIYGMLARVDENNRIHTEYNIGETETGRTSSSNPNLQNLPRSDKDIKTAFVAAPGKIKVELDFSQIEIRVLADLSKDPVLISDLHSGVDIHRKIASSIYGVPPEEVTDDMRSRAKSASFGIIYGMSYKTLAEQKNMSVSEAKEVYDRFFEKYCVAKAWMDSVVLFVKKNKYVRSPFGRIRYLHTIDHPLEELAKSAERCAVNTPIQATGADIPNFAMCKLLDEMPEKEYGYELTMQIHDAIVLDIDIDRQYEVVHKAKDILEHAVALAVPTPVGIKAGFSLGKMKEIEEVHPDRWVYKPEKK